MKIVLAFDFGASSGRAIKAVFDGEKIAYEEIHRFDNIPIQKDGHTYHNVDMIFGEIKKAIDKAGKVDSLAFDTWGVDYGLFDKEGRLINQPYHYRDCRTENVVEEVAKKQDLSELYRLTGNQIMGINTLFQLVSEDNLDKADKIIFMPDLFGYLLTGNAVSEYSIASTSQMLNPVTRQWCSEITDKFGIDTSKFPPLKNSSTVLGEYKGIKVISVAGHDTQCAVCAMPNTSGSNAFLSCGTWSLIGCELDEPILTDESNRLELSNELGANGKVNFLKNISGLWLIQELKRNLAEKGEKYSYNDLECMARESKPFEFFIDPDASELSRHNDLTDKIKSYCRKTHQAEPQTVGEAVRTIYESLALKYRYALRQISECTGKKFDKLNLLGGGTKDSFLCQMTADCLGIPVEAGPIEATALGNIVLQLIADGEISSVDEGRKIIAKTEQVKTYMPNHTMQWDEAYEKFVNIIENN